MHKISMFLLIVFMAVTSMGCSSEDIPQAHKGRMFDRTGALALWAGGKGFEGDVLGPGTYFTGVYDTVRLVDCSQDTAKESLPALTSDNIQFTLDVYITFSANCDDNAAFIAILDKIAPEVSEHADGRTVTRGQVYGRYIRPAIGEAVRQSVSPYKANDINAERDKIFASVIKKFHESVGELQPKFVIINDVKLNNLDFPDTLDQANVQRARVAIEKDIAIAERQKVEEQVITAEKRKQLSQAEGEIEAVKIDEIGKAWSRNKEYLQFRMMQEAGAKGNMIIMGGSAPNLMLTPGK